MGAALASRFIAVNFTVIDIIVLNLHKIIFFRNDHSRGPVACR